MDSGGFVVAKCLNLPAKCDSPVAECRSVSLKPAGTYSTSRAGLSWRGLAGCQIGVARNAGKGSFQMGCHIPFYGSVFVLSEISVTSMYINKMK